MRKPIYQYSDTAVIKDGHTMFHQDACKELQCFQRDIAKLETELENARTATTNQSMADTASEKINAILKELQDDTGLIPQILPPYSRDAGNFEISVRLTTK